MTAAVRIEALSKVFHGTAGQAVVALQDVHLHFPQGSLSSIVGASGCGKSTLLRIIAGLESDYDGRVQVGANAVQAPGLDRGFVFQDHRLVPWMTVHDNIALALHQHPAALQQQIVQEQLALVGLQAFAHVYPVQLSGGMAQRVAIARALSHQPQLLLLDEPFGALDALTRLQLQDELLRICQHTGVTTVVVTHDIEEALYLSDQIVVLSSRPGRVLASLEVPLARPRNRADGQFAALRQALYEQFFASHTRPAAA